MGQAFGGLLFSSNLASNEKRLEYYMRERPLGLWQNTLLNRNKK